MATVGTRANRTHPVGRRNRSGPPTDYTVPSHLEELCHDLRQPAASVAIMAGSVAAGADLSPILREHLQAISRDAERMRSIVHAVLSREDTAGAVDLAALACDIVVSTHVTYSGQVTLAASEPAYIFGRRTELDRALCNLVENAEHAAGPHGHVHVEVAGSDDTVRVSVDDDGPGLLRTRGRVSLGLLIVDRVTRSHAGSVAVADSAFGGTRIEMRFRRFPRTAARVDP